MIELALAMPFIFLIIVSMVFFGQYFLIAQLLLHTAQEEAKIAGRTPNLYDPNVREMISGFTTTGDAVNPQSIIYTALASARLLSQQTSGNMPSGSKVEIILPMDLGGGDSDGSLLDTAVPDGAVEVRIDYPFQLLGNPFQGRSPTVAVAMSLPGGGTPLKFSNLTISERAVAAQEIYQQPSPL